MKKMKEKPGTTNKKLKPKKKKTEATIKPLGILEDRKLFYISKSISLLVRHLLMLMLEKRLPNILLKLI